MNEAYSRGLMNVKVPGAARRTMQRRRSPMAVGDVCTREVVIVFRKDTVADACRLMRERHVGSVVVVGDGGSNAPLGMLTDRDVAIGVVALGLDAEETLVEAVMRPGLAAVSESTPVRDAITIMRDQGVRRLPVVDHAQRLVGLLSADDLLDLLAGEISDLAVMLSRGIGREQRERAPMP
jgi:CBS domain-containing protein